MKQLMRYKIFSGRTTEVQTVLMDMPRAKTKRAVRRKGASTLSQIERNFRGAVRRLARILNSNFEAGDLWLTLTFGNDRLPESRDEAERIMKNFLSRIGRAYKKTAGRPLRYVWVLGERDSKTGDPARMHFHMVMDRVDWALLCKHWPKEDVTYTLIDGRGDYTGIARYMLKNVAKTEGKRAWHPARGLRQPVFSDPVPVKQIGSARIPKAAQINERDDRQDRESGFSASYIRYVLPVEQESRRESDKREPKHRERMCVER